MFAMIQLTFCRTTKMKVEQPKTCRFWNRKYTCKHWTKILSPEIGGKTRFSPHLRWRRLPRKWHFCSSQLRFCMKLMPNAQASSLGSKAPALALYFWTCASFFWWFFTQPFVVSRFLFSFLEPQQVLVSKNPSILSESKIVDHRCSGRLELWMANLRHGRILDSENLNLKGVEHKQHTAS